MQNRKGGGVAVYIDQNIPQMKEWKHLEVEGLETKWITTRPKRLPRDYSLLIVGAN